MYNMTVPLVEQELLTLPSIRFSGVRVTQLLVFCVMLCRPLLSFDHSIVEYFGLALSGYPFGILKPLFIIFDLIYRGKVYCNLFYLGILK